MRKKLLLFIIPLLLTSCSTYDESVVFNAAQEAVNNLQEITYSTYSVSVTGHVGQFTEFNTFEDRAIPAHTLEDNTANRSLGLAAPVVIEKDNFYIETDDISVNTAYFTYNRIKDRLTWAQDYYSYLQFKEEEGNLVFYCERVSKNVSIYNVITDEFMGTPFYSTVTWNARYYLSLTYNSQGLLIEERIISETPVSDDDSLSVDYTSTYTYL